MSNVSTTQCIYNFTQLSVEALIHLFYLLYNIFKLFIVINKIILLYS